MADSKKYEDWFVKAKKDLDGAKIFQKHDDYNELIAFHCHQSVEKHLKGYILKHSKRLLDGHSLPFLIRQATKINEDFDELLDEVAYLNQFYIETRYPQDEPEEVTLNDVQKSIDIADLVFKMVNK